MQELKINERFKTALPPLEQQEYELLEKSLLEDGCRDSLVVWNDTIVDGMNRYEICQKHGIPFKVTCKDFEDEDSAIAWIKIFQGSRRNLAAVDRARLVLEGKEILAVRGRERQVRTVENRNLVLPIFAKQESKTTKNCDKQINEMFGQAKDKPIDTMRILAKEAGLSYETLRKIEKVDQTSAEPIKQAMGKEISIDKAYELTKKILQFPVELREEKATEFVNLEHLRKKKEIDDKEKEVARRQKISDKLESMVFNITTNGTLVTEEYVNYMLDNAMKVSDWTESINHAIHLLQEMKTYLEKNNIIRRMK